MLKHLVLCIQFLTFCHCKNVSFTAETTKCFSGVLTALSDTDWWGPIRLVKGVLSARSCAVECAIQESCAVLQYFNNSKTCILATSCSFQGLWTNEGPCESQVVQSRVKDCSPDPSLNLKAAYNFKLSTVNLVNHLEFNITSIGATFDEDGAQLGSGKYLRMAEPIYEGLGFSKQWTYWIRIKLGAYVSSVAAVLFETCDCTSPNTYQTRFYYSRESSGNLRYLNMATYSDDRMKQKFERIDFTAMTVSEGQSIDIAVVFDVTDFRVYLNGSLITERSHNITSAYSASTASISCTYIGKLGLGDQYFHYGSVQCLGVSYSAMTHAQLQTVFSNYCT